MTGRTGKADSLAHTVVRSPLHMLAFGAGAGLSPWAPGTAGTVVGVLIWLGLAPAPDWVPYAVAGVALIVGIPICGASARRLGVHDHPGIVFDEIAGILAVLCFTPREPLWIFLAFAIFRVTDIYKPWPIRDVDHSLDGGLGIMLDDALAAAYTVLALMVLERILPI
jgi:phosphatidylglycerophosphatase A